MRCRHCGGVVVETLETFPYIGPPGYLVELRDVDTTRCAMCGVGDLREMGVRPCHDLAEGVIWVVLIGLCARGGRFGWAC